MSISLEDARKAAHLARIKIEEKELVGIAKELSAILVFMNQLQEVDVSGVEPMSSVMPMPLRRRPDVVKTGGYPDSILSNAPEANQGFFAVPKVVE